MLRGEGPELAPAGAAVEAEAHARVGAEALARQHQGERRVGGRRGTTVDDDAGAPRRAADDLDGRSGHRIRWAGLPVLALLPVVGIGGGPGMTLAISVLDQLSSALVIGVISGGVYALVRPDPGARVARRLAVVILAVVVTGAYAGDLSLLDRPADDHLPDDDLPDDDIPDDDEIFHVLYDTDHRIQIPGIAPLRYGSTYEQDGVHYHFVSAERFAAFIAEGRLLEYAEVYPGRFYGTLRSEVERAAETGPVLLDIDVQGALNVKRLYGDRALTVFIRPPSLEVLGERQRHRRTEKGGTHSVRRDTPPPAL